MRISKEPEVRKQEMMDTAMRLFAQKGYEGTSMSDIAKAMNVVPGLCYRYFSSKEALYEAALLQYARENAAPIIHIMSQEGLSLEEYMDQIYRNFLYRDGHEKYHTFFHKDGNAYFHRQLELKMIEELLPHMERVLERFEASGAIHIPAKQVKSLAQFILYGQMPIINDDTLTSLQKAECILNIMRKLLQ